MALEPLVLELATNPETGVQQISDPGGDNAPGEEFDPVTNLSISDTTANSMTISWSYSVGAGHDGFEVQVWVDGIHNGWVFESNPGALTRNYTKTGLPDDTLVRWRIRAGNLAGDASDWTQVEGSTDESVGGGGDTDLRRITYSENFESGFNGQSIEAFTDLGASANGICSTERSYGGTRSMRTHCTPRSSGWGSWGWSYVGNKPRMRNGAEVWVRWAQFLPSDWQNQARPSMKVCRIRSFDNRGDPRGMVDHYFDGMRHSLISEPNNSVGWTHASSIFNCRRGEWEIYEYYAKFHHVAKDNGGEAESILWKNGVRAANMTNAYTCSGAGGGFEGTILLHTYYNGEPTYPNRIFHHWIDHVAIARRGVTTAGLTIDDTPHMDRDSQGLPFIGMAVDTSALSE